MRFNPDLPLLVPKEQLDAQFGGDYEYEFEADSYWQQVLESVEHTFLLRLLHSHCMLSVVVGS